jgi:aspartyl aminopeptidase
MLLLVCNDHEEVGSSSSSGAQGPFLSSVLERIVGAKAEHADDFERVIRRSLLLSIDNAHAVHPNFSDKHDDQHGPILNGGPVIKINANQRYASNSNSIARFKSLCENQGVSYQSFVMRSDMACGSTIGPLTATKIGVSTVDIGVPTLGMHSIRELAGADDAEALCRVVTAFYTR